MDDDLSCVALGYRGAHESFYETVGNSRPGLPGNKPISVALSADLMMKRIPHDGDREGANLFVFD